jgi:hypothetical protein
MSRDRCWTRATWLGLLTAGMVLVSAAVWGAEPLNESGPFDRS